jgi:hypothetical protein
MTGGTKPVAENLPDPQDDRLVIPRGRPMEGAQVQARRKLRSDRGSIRRSACGARSSTGQSLNLAPQVGRFRCESPRLRTERRTVLGQRVTLWWLVGARD